MPSAWAGGMLAEEKNPIAAAEFISAAAEVSFVAAMIKAQNLLPKGYLFARFDGDNLMSSGRTDGTLASMPRVSNARAANLFPYAANHWMKSNGSEEYHVWRFDDEAPILKSARPWRDIFDEISNGIGVSSTDRDRGESHNSSPPTPPYVRVRIRRFDGLSTVDVSRRAGESDSGVRRNGFGPFERRVRVSPFPIAAKASDLVIRPHGRFEVSISKRPSIVQAFGRSPRLLCLLLTSALRSGRLATTSVPNPGHSADLSR